MKGHITWEYKEEKLHFKGAKENILNELGADGWELCGIMNDAYGTAYFKRPKHWPSKLGPQKKKSKYKK